MKHRIKAIVFDFDGVVVDSEPLYERTARTLFADYGVTVPNEDWKLFKGMTEDHFYTAACSRYGITAPLPELKARDKEILKSFFSEELQYMPGFRDFFTMIQTRFKTGLVTSSSRTLLEWIFENTAVNNDFINIIAAEDIRRPKPHPEPFLEMGKRLDTAPSEILVIEDSINGIRSARAAGNITVGLTTSFSKNDLHEADYTASDFNEIASILGLTNPGATSA